MTATLPTACAGCSHCRPKPRSVAQRPHVSEKVLTRPELNNAWLPGAAAIRAAVESA